MERVVARDVITYIEKFAPPTLAIEGDNTGLQVEGDLEKSVEKIGVALDPSLKVIERAVKEGVDFLFTHHPLLKDSIRTFDGIIYEKLKILASRDIPLYSAHTNLDICEGGLNDALAELYNLKDVKPLYENGLGRLGIYHGSLKEILKTTEKYICKNPTVINREVVEDRDTLKVAVLSGYGLSQKNIEYVSKVAEVYISGDLTHHSKILAEDLKLSVIDGGHYGTEVYGLRHFLKYLEELGVEVVSLDF
ncbi:MAG TPA: Nif3-like dinuclear metal center hexameric protein [Methanothermococcus okinawensis]|uniref:Nif3-like dinuclear metal center hexameric protein n=1 Tax=Methanothermococcus okinawensis TaxID=155863 RepID=A0A832ZAB2_9EURY|nr:Nif3-like dinuclear metal center hexameric protein [Methanococcaceae archaeon]HIP84164.1 Nif3-like dinuclear metal center hexameric protein [Methanothermococcus okinawensis]HIP91803.1 Nif3-like dinuclear metal center hexameric protein [Methanothermococcus okinawensis]